MTNEISIQEIFSYWTKIRVSYLNILDILEESDLSFSPGPKLLTLGQILTHVAGTYHGWLGGVLQDGADYKRQLTPCKTISRAKILFVNAHQRLQTFLDNCALDDWNKHFIGKYRGENYDYTLHWVIWHLIEHDIHHRAQIKMYMHYLGKKIKGKDFWG